MALSPLHLLQFIVIQLREANRPVSEEVISSSSDTSLVRSWVFLWAFPAWWCLLTCYHQQTHSSSFSFPLHIRKNLSARTMIQDHHVAISTTKFTHCSLHDIWESEIFCMMTPHFHPVSLAFSFNQLVLFLPTSLQASKIRSLLLIQKVF